MTISIAIATYEMHDKGIFFIERAIKSIIKQNYPTEIVISDHSLNNDIENICKNYSQFNIKYIRNNLLRGSSSANFNNAIQYCTGDYIKILCQDDCLYNEDAIKTTVEAIERNNKEWLVSSYYHTTDLELPTSIHVPSVNEYNPLINLIGTHSCLTINKNVDLLFDEKLIWFMDCEYYARLFNKYSHPEYLLTPTVMQSLWSGQVSNSMITNKIITDESTYIKEKHKCS